MKIGRAGLERNWTTDSSDGEHEIFLFLKKKATWKEKKYFSKNQSGLNSEVQDVETEQEDREARK